MRIFLILLRVGVFLVALGGVGACGYLGYTGWDNIVQNKSLETALKQQAAVRVIAKTPKRAQVNEQKADSEVERLSGVARVYPFLLASAVLGFLGGLLALVGRTTSGGVLLLVTAAGPGIVSLPMLIFSSPLIMAALGSFFVSFLAFVTRPKPRAEGDEDEDEEPRKSRPDAKRARFEDADEDEEPPARTKRKSSVDEDEEIESAAKPRGKRKDDFDEVEEEEPPAKSSPKRKVSSEEDEEPEPPARTAAKRKGK